MAASVTSTAVKTAVNPLYSRLLELFPKEYFRLCFAYGSGVLKQGGASSSPPMIDMVFVVDDPEGFHGQNMLVNPSHYSGLRLLGHSTISAIQRWPASLYYNTLVPVPSEKVMLKYGTISTYDFVNDLLDWNHLYVAGRLQKPVVFVSGPASPQLQTALRMNLTSVLHAALLILPQYFTERHLYRTIANVSYNGDFRMVFGEDKNKVKNIVDPQVNEFRKLYKPIFKLLDDYVEIPEDESVDQMCMQDMSPPTRMFHLYQLPKVAQQVLTVEWSTLVKRRKQDTEEILRCIAYDTEDCSQLVSAALRNIVFKSSAQQSLKGILTAGLLRSLKYSSSKIKKMMISKRSS